MTERIRHRQPGDLIGDQVVARLQAIMIEGATLVTTDEEDARLYRTPSGRFFVVAGGELRPVTEAEAIVFRGQQ